MVTLITFFFTLFLQNPRQTLASHQHPELLHHEPGYKSENVLQVSSRLMLLLLPGWRKELGEGSREKHLHHVSNAAAQTSHEKLNTHSVKAFRSAKFT